MVTNVNQIIFNKTHLIIWKVLEGTSIKIRNTSSDPLLVTLINQKRFTKQIFGVLSFRVLPFRAVFPFLVLLHVERIGNWRIKLFDKMLSTLEQSRFILFLLSQINRSPTFFFLVCRNTLLHAIIVRSKM